MTVVMQPDEYIISSSSTIAQVLERLNKIVVKNIYIVDGHNRLIGSITDGDLRRGFINNVKKSDNVEAVMNKSPHKIYSGEQNKGSLVDKFKALGIPSIPIIDFDNKIVEIILLKGAPIEEVQVQAPKDNYVFILAGGEGNRLKPFTHILPKPLIPVGEKPILEIIMDRFKADGFGKFILSLNFKADLIKLYFDNPLVKNKYECIEYVNEKMPLGTIGSLSLATAYITEDFLISNADILVEENVGNIMDFHKEHDAVLTIIGCVKQSILSYGVLEINEVSELIAMDEKPSLKHIVNTGVYAAKPEITDYIKEDTYMDMTQVIELLLRDKKKVCVYQIDDGRWVDIGHWDELQKAINFI